MNDKELELLLMTLTYHMPDSVNNCSCGWGKDGKQLGKSFPEHQVMVYELALSYEDGD